MSIPKHFSLVKEHPQSYELHDARDGRKFHVAKHSLDLGMHGKLSKIQQFADGGEVGETVGSIIGYPGSPKPKPKPKNFKDGGEVNSSSMPKEEPFDPNSLPSQVESQPSFANRAGSAIRSGLSDIVDATKGTPFGPLGTIGAVIPSAFEFGSGLLGNATGSSAEAAHHLNPIRSETSVTPSPEFAQSDKPDPFAAQSSNTSDALSRERAALIAGGDAEALAAKKTAGAYNQMLQDPNFKINPIELRNKYDASDKEHMQAYLENKIDPDHYWHSKNTGQKVAGALGMILGGIGAGMTGGPNYAMDSINKAIERDMDAQKNEQGKHLNLWKMNREALHDDMQANLAFQNQALNAVKAKAMQFASEAAGPMSQARLAPIISQIDQQMGMNNFRRAMMSTAKQGGTIDADPAMLLSQVPEKDRAEAAKEITEAKLYAQGKDHMVQAFDKVSELNTIGNRAGSPIQSTRQIGAIKNTAAMELAKAMAGRVSEYEIKAAVNAFGSMGDSPETTATKRANFLGFLEKNKPPGVVFKGNTGIDLNRFSSTAAQDHAPKAPDPREQQMQYVQQNMASTDPNVQKRVNFIRQKYQF